MNEDSPNHITPDQVIRSVVNALKDEEKNTNSLDRSGSLYSRMSDHVFGVVGIIWVIVVFYVIWQGIKLVWTSITGNDLSSKSEPDDQAMPDVATQSQDAEEIQTESKATLDAPSPTPVPSSMEPKP